MSVGPLAETTDLDALLAGDAQAAIDRATSDVRGRCGWHVAPSLTETITVRAPFKGGRAVLFLPSLLVTAVDAVRVDGVTLDVNDYAWDETGRLALTGGGPFARDCVVEVDLTHGYATVPEDLQGLVLSLAARSKDDPKGNLVQVARGPFSEQYNPGGVAGFNPKAEADVIARYRIPRSR